ncbi:tetratricopeptide repeat protein [bacterium]|nr:tetratricopeptide repeat protein [bacterium]
MNFLINFFVVVFLFACSKKEQPKLTETSQNQQETETQDTLKMKNGFSGIVQDSSFKYYEKALALFDAEKFEEAVPFFQKVLEIDGNKWQAIHELAICYTNLHKFDSATKLYKKTIELNPNFGEAYQNLGNLLFAEKHYKEAIEILEQGFAKTPTKFYTNSFNNLGTAYYFLGNFQKSNEHFENSIRLIPDSSIPNYGIGLNYYNLKNFSESEKYLKKAIKIDDNVDAHLVLGLLYFDTQKDKEAEENFRFYLSKYPNTSYSKIAIEKLTEINKRKKK